MLSSVILLLWGRIDLFLEFRTTSKLNELELKITEDVYFVLCTWHLSYFIHVKPIIMNRMERIKGIRSAQRPLFKIPLTVIILQSCLLSITLLYYYQIHILYNKIFLKPLINSSSIYLIMLINLKSIRVL